MDNSDYIRYGFRLWPFAVLVMLGVLVNGVGPSFYQSLLAGAQGIPLYSLIIVLGIILIQFLGGVIAAAGFFGALYKIFRDAQE